MEQKTKAAQAATPTAEELAEALTPEAADDTRRVHRIEPGQGVRQGDVYLRCVEQVKRGAERFMTVGPGAKGKLGQRDAAGDRHTVTSTGQVEFYARKSRSPLVGPVLVATKRMLVSHPEHADIELPAGTYEVSYQRAHEVGEQRGGEPVID